METTNLDVPSETVLTLKALGALDNLAIHAILTDLEPHTLARLRKHGIDTSNRAKLLREAAKTSWIKVVAENEHTYENIRITRESAVLIRFLAVLEGRTVAEMLAEVVREPIDKRFKNLGIDPEAVRKCARK